MSLTTQQSDRRVDPLPDGLESPRAKLVYLYLEIAGGSTIDDVQETLGVPKITLLSVLDALAGRGLVERDGDAFVPAA